MGGTGRRGAPVRFQPLTMEPPVRDLDLFQLALGLEAPWRVERSEFDAEGKRLDLYIEIKRELADLELHAAGSRSDWTVSYLRAQVKNLVMQADKIDATTLAKSYRDEISAIKTRIQSVLLSRL